MTLPTHLKLKKVTAYTVYASIDDTHSGEQPAVYSDWKVASDKAEHAGWYDSRGEVVPKDNIFQSEDGSEELFEIIPRGQFVDLLEKRREEALANIRAKLNEDEIKLLGI